MPRQSDIIQVLKILREQYKELTMLGSFTDKSPFQILIATVLSARNRDDQTIKVVEKLFPIYPDAKAISEAPLLKLERMIRQTGFYKVKARRIKEISRVLLDEYDGKVPKTMDKLILLPGVGRKTAGCVLVYAFGGDAIPVDTHVHRISNRLGWVRTGSPPDTEQRLMEIVPKRYWNIVNEVFVLHGQNICKPITPSCSRCPVLKFCQRANVKKYH